MRDNAGLDRDDYYTYSILSMVRDRLPRKQVYG
jgi:hypothetical protein